MNDTSGFVQEHKAKEMVEKALDERSNVEFKKYLRGLITGTSIVLFLGLFFFSVSKENIFYAKSQTIKSECEKPLPRNQKCTVFIIAEPEVKE